MTFQSVFSFSRKLITVFFYLVLLLGSLYILFSAYLIYSGSDCITDPQNDSGVSIEVSLVDSTVVARAFELSSDRVMAIQQDAGRYLIIAPYRSPLGYANFALRFFYFGCFLYGILLLKQIFAIAYTNGYYYRITSRLQQLGWLFIIIDMASVSYYLLIGQMAKGAFNGLRLQLTTSIGSYIGVGLIVLFLSLVFRKIIEKQEHEIKFPGKSY